MNKNKRRPYPQQGQNKKKNQAGDNLENKLKRRKRLHKRARSPHDESQFEHLYQELKNININQILEEDESDDYNMLLF